MPAYCRSRDGRVFRVQRFSDITTERARYVLRATPIRQPDAHPIELACELQAALLRDKIRHGQAVPTPEDMFEQLWQQLQLDLAARRA